ncbi:MAG: hypothetical protein C0454_07035 [Parvibaculum sp.]|nr:hypothetical protein [Parvibaculum sp.]
MIDNRQKGEQRGDAAASRRENGARGAALGRELRHMYRKVTQEPIPAEFRELLERLDTSDSK